MIRNEYNGKFFVSEKIDVNGKNTHPVYNFLRRDTPTNPSGQTALIPWNFSKILVDKDGEVKNFYSPATDPLTIIPDIEKLLKKWVNICLREN